MAYLKAAVEETDEPRVLLIAQRHVAQARRIAKVARAAGVERESLYRALSANDNPRLSTLYAVAKAVGLTLARLLIRRVDDEPIDCLRTRRFGTGRFRTGLRLRRHRVSPSKVVAGFRPPFLALCSALSS